jgi:hypothetical protein
MRCEPYCPCVPGPITIKAASGANALPNVDFTSVWLNKRGSVMFLKTFKINKSITLQPPAHVLC